MSATDTLVNALAWPFRQARGTLSNLGGFIGDIEAGDLLPPSVVSTLIWVRDTFPRSLGFSERARMFTASIAFGLVLVISSLGVLTPVGIAWAVFFGGLAALRLVPVVEDYWPWDASSWPFWEVR
jgi:hypothetical protein